MIKTLHKSHSICLPTTRLVFLAFFLFYYVWSSHHGLPLNLSGEPNNNYYGALTDALLHGQLHLLIEPTPELLALPDPYDPNLNYQWRQGIHDLSLYMGRLYVYFGITPALLMWLPARAFGIQMSYELATALFCWGALIASLGFLSNIARISTLSVRGCMWIFVILLLGLSNSVPFLLQRANVYETAISGAYFCTTAGLYFLSRFFIPSVGTRWSLAVGGLFLALAVGARPNFVFWSGTLALVSYLLVRRRGGLLQRSCLFDQLSLWLPYITVGVTLALYNHLRFGSITEFGASYQLAGVNIRELLPNMFQLSSVLPNLYFYLWQPLTVDCIFPFFRAEPFYPGTLPPKYMGPEPVAGALQLSPFLLALLAVPFTSLASRMTKPANPIPLDSVTTAVSGVLVAQAAIQIILLASYLPAASMRYLLDFVPYLLLASVLLCFSLDSWLTSRKDSLVNDLFIILVALLAIYGGIVGSSLGMSGYERMFESKNAIVYEKISNIFVWTKPKDTYKVVLAPLDKQEGRDPIAHTGKKGAGDLVLLERYGGQYRLGIDHWGTPEVWSAWQPLPPSRMLQITLKLDSKTLEALVGNDLLVRSKNAPYCICCDPVFGENRIEFSTAPERARFLVDLSR